MAWFKESLQERIVTALERLAALYELDLKFRGILAEDPEGDGEVIETDEEKVLELIDRRLQAFGVSQPGLYVGEEQLPAGTPTQEEEERIYGIDALFGHSWGLNVGPEGAEESGSGPHGIGSEGIPASGDVRGQRDSEKSEG